MNRGQMDINKRVSMTDARANEKSFFTTSEAYKDLGNIGTEYLANKLSNHLISEINRKLPEIQNYIDKTIADYKRQLTDLGNDVSGNRGKMLHLILTLCQKVEKAFCKIVDAGEGGALLAIVVQLYLSILHAVCWVFDIICTWVVQGLLVLEKLSLCCYGRLYPVVMLL